VKGKEGTERQLSTTGRSAESTAPRPSNLPIPYQVLSADGELRAVNEAWLDTLGYERSAVLDRPFADFLTPTATDRFDAQFSALSCRGRIDGIELELRHAAGHTLEVRIEWAVDYSDGAVDRVHAQFYEGSGVKPREERLQAQNAKIEALHDVATDMEKVEAESAVYSKLVETAEDVLEFDVAIADAAEGDCLVTKAVSEEVDGEDYYDRVPIDDETKLGTEAYRRNQTILERDHAADTDEETPKFRSVLSVPIGEFGVFQAVDQKPGAFDEVDVDLAELLVSHGQNALARIQNMEMLKRQTAFLSRERNRLEAILEAVPEPIVHVRYESEEPIVVRVNSAFEATFGYDMTAIQGESINELIVPEDRMGPAQDLDRQASTTGQTEREVIRTAADGKRTFRLRSSGLDTEGDPEALAIYVDLEEEKAREQELERENERLEKLASIVSHDLRSPLTVAKGRLDMIEPAGEEDHREAVERAIDRMDRIIDDVLTLTRKGRTVTESEREAIDLAELATESWESVESQKGSLAVETERAVYADRSRLRRVLQNLFWNAIEHAGPGVTVTVGELENGFYVADDGPGIPEDKREKVFESGFSTTRDGTGLGLEIVADIVEAHGWSVKLTDAEFGGARFEIEFE